MSQQIFTLGYIFVSFILISRSKQWWPNAYLTHVSNTGIIDVRNCTRKIENINSIFSRGSYFLGPHQRNTPQSKVRVYAHSAEYITMVDTLVQIHICSSIAKKLIPYNVIYAVYIYFQYKWNLGAYRILRLIANAFAYSPAVA